ncbi:hypothetical protein CEXT_434411 [Caerostris extrusa]|uniref:Uncharacterized protein n=1 Tax=Caerostris extrusa TaxID=172846 RepID=A0AAV4UWJ8_CAEEX|nr:hypothetical protein CEXT_434411 [Caerostris extrusa]
MIFSDYEDNINDNVEDDDVENDDVGLIDNDMVESNEILIDAEMHIRRSSNRERVNSVQRRINFFNSFQS